MVKKTLSSQKGFTLVEIVMVMVIIGLLAAIVVPKFTVQREQAGIAATKANLENLRTAISLYYAKENAWPSDDLATLHDGNSGTGTIYIKSIPSTMTYDPTGTAPTPAKSVQVVNSSSGDGGWFWDNTNHELYVNLSGADAEGTPFSQY